MRWKKTVWAATWQNQQCGCAPSEDSDQPGHSPSLIRVFAVRMKKPWVLSYPLSATAKTLIRLGGCPGWSESSMGAHSVCWFSHVVAHFGYRAWILCGHKYKNRSKIWTYDGSQSRWPVVFNLFSLSLLDKSWGDRDFLMKMEQKKKKKFYFPFRVGWFRGTANIFMDGLIFAAFKCIV